MKRAGPRGGNRFVVEQAVWCGLIVLVWGVVTGCAWLAADPDGAPYPPGINAKGRMKNEKLKTTPNATLNSAFFISPTSPTVFTLAADFPATGIGGLTAWFEVTQDFTNWTRLEQPYPFSGGTLTQSYTNQAEFGTNYFFWRAGYTIN